MTPPPLPPVDDDALVRASQAPIVKVAGIALFSAGALALSVALQFALVVVRARTWVYGLQGLFALAGLICAGAGLRVLGRSLGAGRVAVVASGAALGLGLAWVAIALLGGLLSPLALLSPVVSGLALAATMLAVPCLRIIDRAHAELLA
jgi:hypothetical protein